MGAIFNCVKMLNFDYIESENEGIDENDKL